MQAVPNILQYIYILKMYCTCSKISTLVRAVITKHIQGFSVPIWKSTPYYVYVCSTPYAEPLLAAGGKVVVPVTRLFAPPQSSPNIISRIPELLHVYIHIYIYIYIAVGNLYWCEILKTRQSLPLAV